MKILQKWAGFVSLTLISSQLTAQRVHLIEGNLAPLKNETSVAIEFVYDNMRVGKFDKEADYISKKEDDYNKKESGRGDTWAKSWVSDRQNRYEPRFVELFQKYSDRSSSKTAKYTLILKTIRTEPGFNIGVMKKNAEIDADAWIVETANKGTIIAKISIERVPGRSFFGNDYDTGERIAECYADAGKALGKFIKSKS